MQKIYTKVTDEMNFYEGNDPTALAREYGTPLLSIMKGFYAPDAGN